MIVAKHEIPDGIMKSLSRRYNASSLDKLYYFFKHFFLNQKDKYVLGAFKNNFFQKFLYGNELEKSPEEIYRYLTYARDLQLYIFKERITPKGESFSIPIARELAQGTGMPIGEYTSAPDWMLCWHLCLITKYKEGIDLLEEIPTEVFKKDTSRVEPFHYKIVKFYKSLFQKYEVIESAFKEAYEYTNTDKYPPSHEYLKELVLFLYTPLLEVFLGIITKDEKLYNEKLYEGLKDFKYFVEREPEDEDDIPRTAEYHWFIAWGYLASVRLAQFNGLETKVSSGYLPKWLVDGNFEDLPTYLPEKE